MTPFLFNNPKNMVTESESEDNKQVVRPHVSHVPRQACVSEEKRSYDDCVNYLKKSASDARDRAEIYFLVVKAANESRSYELHVATELFKMMHNKYVRLLADFNFGIVQREVQNYLWNRFESDDSDDSDDSNDSTPSGNATGGASKRVEEYLDGVKAATEATMSPPWELPEAIRMYKIIKKKELVEVM
jgi:hypothetical protein